MMRMTMRWDITEFHVEWQKEEKKYFLCNEIIFESHSITLTVEKLPTKSVLETSTVVHGPNKPNNLSYRNKC